MWYKDYGAQVKKGDILAEINAPALDAEYATGQGGSGHRNAPSIALAEVTAKRWVALRTNHAVSEQSITVQVAKRESPGGDGQGRRTKGQEHRGVHSVQNDRRARLTVW